MSEEPPAPQQMSDLGPDSLNDPALKAELDAKLFTQQDSIEAAKRLWDAEQRATRDPLTGLYNRGGLFRAVERIDPHDGKQRYVIFADMLNFKEVNEVFNHKRGDTVIKDTGSRIAASLRPEDLLARLGGDEFVAVIDDTPREDSQMTAEERPAAFKAATEKIRTTITHGMYRYIEDNLDLQGLHLQISVGVIPWDPDVPFEEVLDQADKLMKAHKDDQREEFGTYRPMHSVTSPKL